MNKNRSMFLTDAILVPAFVLSLYTGIDLHLAGHGTNHEIWQMWAVFHTIASLLFMTFAALHVRSHWSWYRSLKTAGCKGGRRKVVLLLSVVFATVAVTGLLLLFFIDGAGSSVGLFHYKAGLALALLGCLHVLKRRKILFNGIRIYIFGNKRES